MDRSERNKYNKSLFPQMAHGSYKTPRRPYWEDPEEKESHLTKWQVVREERE